MGLAKDPNDRRRVDGDTQLKRDAEVARLRDAHVPFREIGRRLGMSLGSVQKALRRYQMRQAQLAELERGLEDEGGDEDEFGPFSGLRDEELTRLNLAEVLKDLAADPTNELALHRLRYIPRDTPGHPSRGNG
jgi:DNA-binding CsgD family transcriptional regulator